MSYKPKKLSIFAERIIPGFIQTDYPNYVTLIRKYFEYLERRVDIYQQYIVEIYPGNLFAPENNWSGSYLKLTTNDLSILEQFEGREVGNTNSIAKAVEIVDYEGDYLLKVQAISNPFVIGDRLAYSDVGEYTRIAELFMFHDVDECFNEFMYLHREDMLMDFPEQLYGNLRLLLKRIKTFYATKGTEASFEMLFSIVYNTFVEITYPKKDILIASDGEWKVGTYFEFVGEAETDEYSFIAAFPETPISAMNPENAQIWQDKFIVGEKSGARGYLESFVYTEYPAGGGISKWVGYVVDIIGQFQPTEMIIDSQTGEELDLLLSYDTQPGRWLSDKGHLSGTKKLQDNARYQNFTYVLKTDISSSEYTELVDKLVHPVGFLRFTEIGEKALESIPATDMSLAYLLWVINMYVLDIQFPFEEVYHKLLTKNWLYTDRGIRYTYRDIERERERDLQVVALWGHRCDTLDVFACEDFDNMTDDPFEFRPPSLHIII